MFPKEQKERFLPEKDALRENLFQGQTMEKNAAFPLLIADEKGEAVLAGGELELAEGEGMPVIPAVGA